MLDYMIQLQTHSLEFLNPRLKYMIIRHFKQMTSFASDIIIFLMEIYSLQVEPNIIIQWEMGQELPMSLIGQNQRKQNGSNLEIGTLIVGMK